MGVPVGDDPLDAIVKAQAVIDFTAPATLAHAQLTAQARCVHVIGTTGLCSDDEHCRAGCRRTPRGDRAAGNMSLGVNLLTRLVSADRRRRSTPDSTSRWSRRTTATRSMRPPAPR
jgi:4-hydroxy-tetrahydrodipicolinate reductase